MNLDAFRYSTILALTRNGINTMEELDRLTNEQIAGMRGIGARAYIPDIGQADGGSA